MTVNASSIIMYYFKRCSTILQKVNALKNNRRLRIYNLKIEYEVWIWHNDIHLFQWQGTHTRTHKRLSYMSLHIILQRWLNTPYAISSHSIGLGIVYSKRWCWYSCLYECFVNVRNSTYVSALSENNLTLIDISHTWSVIASRSACHSIFGAGS